MLSISLSAQLIVNYPKAFEEDIIITQFDRTSMGIKGDVEKVSIAYEGWELHTYYFDKEGRLSCYVMLQPGKPYQDSVVYSYGKRSLIKKVYGSGIDSIAYQELQNYFNRAGNVSKAIYLSRQYHQAGAANLKIDFQYDRKGRLLSKRVLKQYLGDTDYKLTEEQFIRYREEGDITHKEVETVMHNVDWYSKSFDYKPNYMFSKAYFGLRSDDQLAYYTDQAVYMNVEDAYEPSDTLFYTYNENGKRLSEKRKTSYRPNYTFLYDEQDRVFKKQALGFVFTYTYDKNGRIASVAQTQGGSPYLTQHIAFNDKGNWKQFNLSRPGEADQVFTFSYTYY
jgi:YD repeat-containing protein